MPLVLLLLFAMIFLIKRDITYITHLTLRIFALIIEFDDSKKLAYDDLTEPGLSNGKTLIQTVSIVVKTNENQSVKSKKFNPMFQKKVITDCCDPD